MTEQTGVQETVRTVTSRWEMGILKPELLARYRAVLGDPNLSDETIGKIHYFMTFIARELLTLEDGRRLLRHRGHRAHRYEGREAAPQHGFAMVSRKT